MAVAKQNAKKHKVKIKFIHGNLLQSIPNSKFKIPNSNIIITANLPYLTEKQYKNEPSIKHEPKSALVAKKDGLALYEELLNQIKSRGTTRDTDFISRLTIYLEIDPSQSKKIIVLIKKILQNAKIEIKKDLAGKNRMIIID